MKTGPGFDPNSYATVAERVRSFYVAYPLGRIETDMVDRTEQEIVFKALVYRQPNDKRPAATCWAAERIGDGEINVVACLENTETSAVGRALANLGFTGTRQRPSAEEMAKSSRVRARLTLDRPESVPGVGSVHHQPTDRPGGEATRSPAIDGQAALVRDLLSLLRRATALGIRSVRVQRWTGALHATDLNTTDLMRCERRLRLWIDRHRRTST